MASRQALDRERFEAITARTADPVSRTPLLGEARLREYLASGRALTLTDDFVPVDQWLARVFVERAR